MPEHQPRMEQQRLANAFCESQTFLKNGVLGRVRLQRFLCSVHISWEVVGWRVMQLNAMVLGQVFQRLYRFRRCDSQEP